MSAAEPPPFIAELRQEFRRVVEADAEVAAASGTTVRPRRLRLRRFDLSRLRVALPVLAALAALGGVTVVATDVVSVSGDSQPGTSAPAQSGAFSDELVQQVSMLGRPRTDADVIGTDVAQLPADVEPGAALHVVPPPPPADSTHATPSDAENWLLPADRGDLVIGMSVAGTPVWALTRADSSRVERGLAVGARGDNLIGVVPNGVESVTVRLKSGESVELPVRDNVFGAHLDGDFAGVEWSGMQRP
jgi:hypothetical protein